MWYQSVVKQPKQVVLNDLISLPEYRWQSSRQTSIRRCGRGRYRFSDTIRGGANWSPLLSSVPRVGDCSRERGRAQITRREVVSRRQCNNAEGARAIVLTRIIWSAVVAKAKVRGRRLNETTSVFVYWVACNRRAYLILTSWVCTRLEPSGIHIAPDGLLYWITISLINIENYCTLDYTNHN